MNSAYTTLSTKVRALAIVFSCVISATLLATIAVGLTSHNDVASVDSARGNASTSSVNQNA